MDRAHKKYRLHLKNRHAGRVQVEFGRELASENLQASARHRLISGSFGSFGILYMEKF